MSNKNIKVISTHATLAEAVTASGIDLSYNLEEAKRKIANLERNGAGKAFVTDQGVLFLMKCDIRILSKFEPFHSVMDDSPFSIVIDKGAFFELLENKIPCDKEARKIIARADLLVTKI